MNYKIFVFQIIQVVFTETILENKNWFMYYLEIYLFSEIQSR